MKKVWRVAAAGLAVLAAGSAGAAIETAGTVYVDLNATSLVGAVNGTAVTNWGNAGTLGAFTNGGPAAPSYSAAVGGVPAVTFNGTTNYLRTWGTGAPADITANGSYAIEVWVYNPSVPAEESMFSWAPRGGGNGTAAQFNYGTDGTFGAATHWGAAGDMGYVGAPVTNQWHHLVLTFDGATERVYVDGLPNNSEAKTLAIRTGYDLYLGGAQKSTTDQGAAILFSGSIAQVRMHGDALAFGQIATNYLNDYAGFGRVSTPQQLAAVTGTGAWNVASTWQFGVVPSAAPAIVNNGATVWLTNAVPSVTGSIFSNGTLWVQGGSVQATAASWIGVGAGQSATLVMDGGSITNSAGNFRFGENGATGVGTINSNSTLYLPAGELWLGQGAGGRGIVTNNGGAITVANNWIAVGRQPGYGQYVQTGGSLTKTGGGQFIIGSLGGTGEVTLAGGTMTINNGVVMAETANLGKGTFTLSGGRLTANYVGKMTATAKEAIFNFNGGTLSPNANTATFMQGLDQANVQAGGAVFDTAGFGVTVAQNLLDGGGGGGLTKNGPGNLTLSGTNAFTGGMTVNGGALLFASTDAIAGSGANVTVNGGGGAGTTYAIDQAFLGRIAASSTGAAVLGSDSANALDFAAAGLANASLGSAGAFTFSGSLAPASGVYRLGGGGGTLTNNAALSGANALVVNGNGNTGTVVLNAVNSHSGGTTVNGGTLSIAASDHLGGTGTALTIDGGRLQMTGTALTTLDAHLLTWGAAGGGFDIADAGNTFTVSSNLAGGALLKTGAGTLALAGANSYAGGTTINGGVLRVTDDANLGAAAGGLTMGGGRLQLAAGITNARPIVFTAASDLEVAAGPSSLLGGAFGGNFALNKRGAGTLVMTNRGAIGNLFVREGELVLHDAAMTNGAWVSIGQNAGENGTLSLRGSTVMQAPADFNISDLTGSTGTVTVADNALLQSGNLYVGKNGTSMGTLTLSDNAVIRPATLIVGAYGTSLGTVVQAGGAITNTGTGDWRVGGAGSAADAGAKGRYHLYDGSLYTTANLQIGAYGRGELVMTGGTITVVNNWPVIGRFPGSVGEATISGGTFSQASAGNRMIVGEQGNGTLTVTNRGVVDLTGGLVVGGIGATVGTGTVNLATGGRIKTAFANGGNASGLSTLNLGGGVLEARGASATFLQGFTQANVNDGGAVFDTAGFSVTVAQVLSSNSAAGGLTKLGAGSLTLSGASTYAGPTVVSNGVLALSGAGSIAQSSSIRVASGATVDVSAVTGGFTLQTNQTLSGHGTVLGGVSLADGAVLSPGSSPGLIAMGGSLNAQAGSTMLFELVSTSAYDRVTGVADLALAGTVQVVLIDGFIPAPGDVFDLLDWSGTMTDGGYALDTPSLGGGMSWNTDNFEVDGTIAVIPEPATAGLFILTLAAAVLRRRRRA